MRGVYDVTEFGASGSGELADCAANTKAIQAAIDAALENGGGIVRFPPGHYYSGTLVLGSDLEFRLEAGALLQGSPHIEDYHTVESLDAIDRKGWVNTDLTGKHFLIAHDADRITIDGHGVIDGSDRSFWGPQEAPETWIPAKHGERPSPMINLVHVRDLKISGITVRKSPGWTFGLWDCDRVTVHGVRVINDFWGPNTDAFDIVGCRDVHISDCYVEASDDAFVIKTMPYTRSAERITITNCTMKTNCVGLKVGAMESHQPFRQITFSNSVVYQSTRGIGLYSFHGGDIEDVVISNIVIDTKNKMILNRPIHIDLREQSGEWGAGKLRNCLIENVVARTDGRFLLTAADGSRMENLSVSNVLVDYYKVDDPGPTGRDAGGNQFSNHSKDARAAQSAFVIEGAKNLTLKDISINWPEGVEHPMHAFWLKDVAGARIEAPLAEPLNGASKIEMTDCSRVRASD